MNKGCSMEQNAIKIKDYWRCPRCGRVNLDRLQCPCGALPECGPVKPPVDGQLGSFTGNCKIIKKLK